MKWLGFFLLLAFFIDGIVGQRRACGLNEEYDNCILPCPPQNCQDLSPTNYECSNADLDRRNCRAGCRCKKNYKRNQSGVCVPIASCPAKPCPRNEEWVVCRPMPLCVNERCKPIRPLACAYLWDGVCIPRCLCKRGYCRNLSDQCVKSLQSNNIVNAIADTLDESVSTSPPFYLTF